MRKLLGKLFELPVYSGDILEDADAGAVCVDGALYDNYNAVSHFESDGQLYSVGNLSWPSNLDVFVFLMRQYFNSLLSTANKVDISVNGIQDEYVKVSFIEDAIDGFTLSDMGLTDERVH